MNKLIKTYLFFTSLLLPALSFAQELPFQAAEISVSPAIQHSFVRGGRILIYLSAKTGKEPRRNSDLLIGYTPSDWDGTTALILDSKDKMIRHTDLANGFVPEPKKFYYQAVYKQNIDDGQANVPGNIVSEIDSVDIVGGSARLNVRFNKIIPPYEIVQNKFVRNVVIQSKCLTEFSGHPRYLKASILLPSGYFDNPGLSYPVCYRVPGLNGRYDGVNGMIKNPQFSEWWFSKGTPQIIYVFVDSQGPFGDSYQVDSENNGPCGKAFTQELIPEIEKLVHYDSNSGKRYLAGASTGGWVVLGLQIFYPDFFNGAWAYSPDPVDFEHYGLINIYKDESAFYNRFGYLQPESRTVLGEP